MLIRVCNVLLVCAAVVVTDYLEPCTTPNDVEGECIALSSCPVVLDALKTGHNAKIEFARKAICGFNGTEPLVCCSFLPVFPVLNKDGGADTEAVTENPMISTRQFCGYQHADDYARKPQAESISIHEFPWLALLLLEDINKTVRGMCAGSLINHRYVLTAAHCLVHRKYNLVGVRLGEYNIKNHTDCIEDGQFSECSDPVQEFGIEKTIPHPEFSWKKFSINIALVRLNESVVYSEFIRPICLPLPGVIFSEPGDIITISGWSKRVTDNRTVEIKKKIMREKISSDECALTYTTRPVRDDQFCTKVIDTDKELCQGDSGGPVMFSNRLQWHQEGIYITGANCSSRVGVHLSIASYLDWITENMEL